MPIARVRLPDGRIGRFEVAEGLSPAEVESYISAMFPAEPTRPAERDTTEMEDQSVFRQVADIPLQVGTGIAQGIRFISDAFGADNPVSQNIRGVEGYLQNLLSAQAKEDQAEVSRIMQEAQDKGVGEQVVAGLEAFATAPLDTLSQAAGTALPTIVGGLAGGALRGAAGAIASRAAIPAIGAVTGAGVTKSSIYDATEQAMLEAGATPEQAKQTAQQAQEYGGKNLDQILIGSGLGVFAAGTGLEKAVAGRILGRAAAQEAVEQGAARRIAVGAATEATPEALQAAQEQMAQNIALQREGFDVPTLRGVAGAAAMEGIAGGALGGGFGALGPAQAEVTQPIEKARTPEITPPVTAPVTPVSAEELFPETTETTREERRAAIEQRARELRLAAQQQPENLEAIAQYEAALRRPFREAEQMGLPLEGGFAQVDLFAPTEPGEPVPSMYRPAEEALAGLKPRSRAYKEEAKDLGLKLDRKGNLKPNQFVPEITSGVSPDQERFEFEQQQQLALTQPAPLVGQGDLFAEGVPLPRGGEMQIVPSRPEMPVVQRVPESQLALDLPVAEEITRESVPSGVSEAVAGAAPRGIELPVSRARPAGSEAATPSVTGLEPVSVTPQRFDERKEVGPAALKPIESAVDKFDDEQIKELAPLAYKSREKLIEMPIETFLSLVKPGRMKVKEDEVKSLLEKGTKFSSIPFLNAYSTKDGDLKVEGHEGRHRARALKDAGYTTMPVIIRSDIRWSEQVDPEARDYEKNWPTKIISETGDKSVPMFISREDAATDYTPEARFQIGAVPAAPMLAPERVQSIVQDLTKGWTNSPNIVIARNAQDPALKSFKGRIPANSPGFYSNGTTYIIADRAKDEGGIRGTVFHESLGHYGLSNLFRDKLDDTLKDIYLTNTAVRSAADQWTRANPNVYNGQDQLIRATEEILAARAETGIIKEPGIRAAFNRIAAMIRKFLRGIGVVKTYTNNDIANIMRVAADRVRTGAPVKLSMPDASPKYQVSNYNKVLSSVLERNQQLPEWSQGLGDGVVQVMSTLPENLRKSQYYVYSTPHIVELLERYVPRIKAIERLLGYRAAYSSDLMKTASENHARYTRIVQRDPAKYDAFKEVANDINLYQVEVRSQRVLNLLKEPRGSLSPQNQKYYDIAKRFYALPPAFQNAILSADGKSGLFADYRKMSDEKFDIFAEVYGGRLGSGLVRELRERFDKERLPMYAPLVRGEGAHWLYYETQDGRQVKQPFANSAAREVEIKRITQEGIAKADTVVRATRASELRDRGAPPVGFLGDVVSALEVQLKDTPQEQRRQIIDSVYDTFLQYLPSNMLRQELSSRQKFDLDGAMQFGVLGFDQDVLAVYERTMPKMAYQLGNLKFALPLEDAMRKIKEQATLYEIAVRENDIPDRLKGRSLMSPKAVFDGVEDMRRRLDFAYNPSYAWWVNASSTGNYLYSIAGNVSSALINTTILPMMTFPSLVARYGLTRSIAAMGQASKAFLGGGVDAQGNFTFGNKATGEAKAFFDYLTRRGAIGIAAEQELRQAQRASVSGYENTLDKINFVLGYVFKNSERFNREVTLLASFNLARASGKGFRTAAEEAIRLNNNINGTTLPELNSRLYQTNFGRVILTFRTYAVTQIINLSRAFGRALKLIDATPEERSYARKQLLGIYGMTYLVAGAKGLPLFGAAEVLAAALMGDDDEPYDLQQEILDSMGAMGLNGPLNAALQLDIASRTGFNGMLWRDDPKRLADIGLPLYVIERVLGPTYGLVQAQLRGIEKIGEGEVARGLESILPAPLRNPIKATRYATEGALNKDGLPIVDDVSTWNSVMQIFGFAPAELALTQEQISATYAISDKLRNRRAALLTNVYAATESGDPQAMLDAYEAVDKFNLANPMYQINAKSLRASFRERQRRAMEAVNGVYLPRNLRMATDDLMADLT